MIKPFFVDRERIIPSKFTFKIRIVFELPTCKEYINQYLPDTNISEHPFGIPNRSFSY